MIPASPLSENPVDRKALRSELLARRQALEQRPSRDAAIAAALQSRLRGLKPECVGAYCATRGEFDPLPALTALCAEHAGLSLALPVVDTASRGMRFVAWAPGQALREGPYGILEPADTSRTVDPGTLLLPCVGFVEIGLRLGYGGGYYDRYLAGRGDVYTIGLAYDCCHIEHLAPEPHDHLLDLILTETAAWGIEAALGDEE